MKRLFLLFCLLTLPATFFTAYALSPGDEIDSFNGVIVYHNDGVNNTYGRNTVDGYNLGLKYQCVEFVKRYYYERFNHKMPETYGHAKDFFDHSVKDGALNAARNLLQYKNEGRSKPQVDDLLVMHGGSGILQQYGHVAIVSAVGKDYIELVQQNMGASRMKLPLVERGAVWYVDNTAVLGWLRRAEQSR